MNLLLHTCCAPCSIMCINTLRKEANIETELYWYNPNIHPFKEYESRKKALEEYSKIIDINVIYNDIYGLKNFVKNTIDDLQNRCENYCYKERFEETAKCAVENGYDAFSTTLLISPYQNHEKIIEICENIAKKYDIQFLYRDFRPYFREGQVIARSLDLYMQKYCGCIFSEEERYR